MMCTRKRDRELRDERSAQTDFSVLSRIASSELKTYCLRRSHFIAHSGMIDFRMDSRL